MRYHAFLEFTPGHYRWNYTKEEIINELLIPFVNGQVIFVKSGNKKILLNLRHIIRLKLFKTSNPLAPTESQSILQQMQDPLFDQYECAEELIQDAKLALASSNSTSLLQKSFERQLNQAFVIMKFGDKILDSAYEGVIKPTFAHYGINVIRVDELQNSGKISDQILELIASSKYILAELTGSRPNCYYETGFAHALGKEIILCCNKSEIVHFDLAGYRFIVWETENDLRKELLKRVVSLLDK